MRVTDKHELKNYLANRRIAYIQKAHRPLHIQVQLTNNRLVDKKIIEWNDELSSDVYDHYKPSTIAAEINGYNRIATSKDLQRILQHSVIARNPQTELEASKVINSVSETITTAEVERTLKNLEYVENVLTQADVDIAKYEALVEKLPQTTSRKAVLERCITEGTELPATKRQALLERALSRGEWGVNYKGKRYSYKEGKQLAKNLERYKQNRLTYETKLMENRQANREGYGDLNQTKVWEWTPNERTRHEGMTAHDPIPLTAKFEVVNDATGDVDYLLYPNDIDNDHNNCSNICNCMCTYSIQ